MQGWWKTRARTSSSRLWPHSRIPPTLWNKTPDHKQNSLNGRQHRVLMLDMEGPGQSPCLDSCFTLRGEYPFFPSLETHKITHGAYGHICTHIYRRALTFDITLIFHSIWSFFSFLTFSIFKWAKFPYYQMLFGSWHFCSLYFHHYTSLCAKYLRENILALLRVFLSLCFPCAWMVTFLFPSLVQLIICFLPGRICLLDARKHDWDNKTPILLIFWESLHLEQEG